MSLKCPIYFTFYDLVLSIEINYAYIGDENEYYKIYTKIFRIKRIALFYSVSHYANIKKYGYAEMRGQYRCGNAKMKTL